MRTSESKNERFKQFLLVGGILLAIGVITLSAEMLRDDRYDGYRQIITTTPFVARMILVMFLAALAATGHYYFLFQQYFAKKKYALYGGLLLVSITGLIFLDGGLSALLEKRTQVAVSDFTWGLRVGLWRVILWDLSFAIVYCAIRVNINLRKRKNELERQQLKSSLLLLRNQLEPHFLFNTLNTIYATAQNEKAQSTAACIEELSQLFRYSITEANKDTVPVEKELTFIERYIHLQRTRVQEGNEVEIACDISWDHQHSEIAPMLLIPIIENAFKYGVSYDNRSQISIALQVKNSTLHLSVANTLHAGRQVISNGTGMANTQQRLDLIYKGKYTLRQEENEVYRVTLDINLN